MFPYLTYQCASLTGYLGEMLPSYISESLSSNVYKLAVRVNLGSLLDINIGHDIQTKY